MICQFHHVDIFKVYFCLMYLSMMLSFTTGSHNMSYHLVSLVPAAGTVNLILLNLMFMEPRIARCVFYITNEMQLV